MFTCATVSSSVQEANLIWCRLKLGQVKVGAIQVLGTLTMGQFELNLGPVGELVVVSSLLVFFKK